MSWNLWPSAAPELPRPEDEPADRNGSAVDLLDDPLDTVQVLSPTEEETGCWHVRPVPPSESDRRSPAIREPELRRHRPADEPDQRTDLRGIGLPEHLVPPRGGIFALLTLLERMPPARRLSVRPGDEVTVVAVRSADGPRGVLADLAALGDEVRCVLERDGNRVEEEQIHVVEWPVEEDPSRGARAEVELVDRVRSLRSRLEFIAVHPDCAATVAYAACRALPSAQLYLTGVLGSQRPAAPLGWGAPIAFVDGRPASPAMIAAVLADRLAGGVA